MIHDVTVPAVDPVARPDGHARFGAIVPGDAALLGKMGSGNNVPGRTFTTDGRKPHFASSSDRFPDVQTNVVPIYLIPSTTARSGSCSPSCPGLAPAE
jgi:hypothetical protein